MRQLTAIRVATVAVVALFMALGAALLPPAHVSAATPPPSETPDWSGRDPKTDQASGGQIYREVCAACHDAGLERAPQLMALDDMTPEAIHRALTDGAMREQGKLISAAQRVEVAEYIAGRKMGSSSSAALLGLCPPARRGFDLTEPPVLAGWGLDAASTHAIPARVSGLNARNAPRLKLRWAFAFPHSSRARSQPALAGGAIIVGNHNGAVYALDQQTGCVRWAFEAQAEVRTGIVVNRWRKGDRAARPLVYFGDTLGNVYAVSLLDGKQVWTLRADAHPAALITGTPTLHAGTLYVPVSSVEEAFATSPNYACCSFRGSVVALDALTGAQKWRTWLVDPPAQTGTSKTGLPKLGPSGVAVWNSPAIDAARGQLYVATGDNYTLPATGLSDAVVALDLATGRIRWQHQVLGGDAWNVACVTKTSDSCPDVDAPDFDFGAGAVLAKSDKGRELVLAGQKSGWVYAFDPADGTLVWKQRLGRGSPSGGVHFGIAADAGRLFVPMSDRFAMPGPDPFPAQPGLYALDVATGESLWAAPDRVNLCTTDPRCLAGYGGAVTVTGGLVLIGADDGHVRIYNASTGAVLWQDQTRRSFDTVNKVPGRGGSISGGVAPLAYKGDLIVPSGYGFASKAAGNVLLVYGVD